MVSSSPQVTAGRGRGTAPKVGGRGQPRQPPPAAAGRGQPPAQMAMPELQEISQSKESQLRLQLVQQHQLFQQQQHNQQEQEQKQQQQLVGQQQPPQQQQEQEQKQQPQFVGLPEQQPQQQPPFPLQHTPPTVGRGAPLPHLVPQEQQQPAPLAVGRGAPLAAPPAVAASRVPTGSRVCFEIFKVECYRVSYTTPRLWYSREVVNILNNTGCRVEQIRNVGVSKLSFSKQC